MSTPLVRTRFAPSPTGFLHVGAFRTALFSWLFARKHGGAFVLRIEDTDQTRLVPGSLESIVASLRVLGLGYDEGPDQASVAKLDAGKYGAVDPSLLPVDGGKHGPYFQSQRLARYDVLIEQLLEEGKAYHAFETKEELEAQRAAADARKVPFLYNRHYRDTPLAETRRRVAAGEPHVVRLKMPVDGPILAHDHLRGEMVWDSRTQDDFVIRKADGYPPYHFAAMVDDHDMEISHVLRGDDWLPSLPKHVQVFRAFEWEPPVFVHTPNVLAPGGGKKLSKRHGAKPILGPVPELKDGVPTGEMTEGLVNGEGYLPEAIVNFLALIGWSPGDNREVMPIEEIIDAFSLEAISRSGGAFDAEKLLWMNGVYLRKMPARSLAARAMPFLVEAGLVDAQAGEVEIAYAAEAVALEQEKIQRLDEAPRLVDFFFSPPEFEEKAVARWLHKGGIDAYLGELGAALAGLPDWSTEAIETAVRGVAATHGREKGEATHPVRVALTGRETGPSLFDLMRVLGRDTVVARLDAAREKTGV
ncbi:MAG: glutamate--tRNA ligase [Armatimonadota bacterium]